MVEYAYFILCILTIVITVLYTIVSLKKVNYEDYNLKFYMSNLLEQIRKILFKIMLLLFAVIFANGIYRILLLIEVTKYINIVSDWIIKNKEAFNTVLGAFLASILGIITQAMVNRNYQRKEQSKNSRLLYNDQKYILYMLDRYQSAVSLYDDSKTQLFDILFKKINFDNNWREYYGYLSDKLPITYYNKIIEIYSLVEGFNVAIENRDIDKVKNVMTDLRLIDKTFTLPGDVNYVSNKDLLEALYRLSQNKRIKSKVLANLIKEIKIKRAKQKYTTIIEEEIYNLVLTSKETDSYIINNKVKVRLKSNYRYFNKMNDRVIDRIIFEVSVKSEKTKLDWGEYSIVEKNNTK